jgi:hypothetical protein
MPNFTRKNKQVEDFTQHSSHSLTYSHSYFHFLFSTKHTKYCRPFSHPTTGHNMKGSNIFSRSKTATHTTRMWPTDRLWPLRGHRGHQMEEWKSQGMSKVRRRGFLAFHWSKWLKKWTSALFWHQIRFSVQTPEETYAAAHEDFVTVETLSLTRSFVFKMRTVWSEICNSRLTEVWILVLRAQNMWIHSNYEMKPVNNVKNIILYTIRKKWAKILNHYMHNI